MDTKLIEHLKEFLSKNDVDGILVNSTNEFLVEYNLLEENARYHLTDFTGSTGDVLFTADKIYLFVDTRYHEQADNQVDKSLIEVVKIPLNKSYLTALEEVIPAYFKLGIVSTKTSKKFYDVLEKKLQAKNSTIRLFNSDPVIEYKKDSIKNINYNVFKVDTNICGLTADEKFETIKKYAGENFTIIVTSLEDIAYITNLRSFDFQYSAIFPAKAIISDEGINIYTNCDLPYIGGHFKTQPLESFENDIKSLARKEIFIDETQMSIHDYKLINPSNKILQSHLSLFKSVKHQNEINHLKSCFGRSDNALRVIYEMLNSETIYSEYDYYQAIVKSLKDNGALSLSFNPIVAGGSNTSIIHYSSPSKEKMIEDGDLLLIDFGAYYEGGLATDTTRTFIKGNATQEQKTAYTSVLKAFLNAYYNKYSKKSSYFNIDKIARDTINKSISNDYQFAHGTGHGVGISVHENPPRVSPSNSAKTKIIENTVFSIEPGVYKEGWGGIRLENTVYATYEEDKIVINNFSHFPFEIKLVDLSMMNDYEKYYYMKWQATSCVQ
ncbi:MAG: M24 family metallopeptidase [Cyanobacteria bacterium SIG29]|nr:M24 family metallopeptidase [Cyanobacteria bacterium SIG29]